MDLHHVLEDVRRGMIPAHIYNDEELFALEKERVFGARLDLRRPRVRGPGARRLRRAPRRRRLLHHHPRRGGRGPRAVQHVPAPRHAGVPRRDRQRVALPLSVPRRGRTRTTAELVGLPFHRDAYGGEAGLRREGRRRCCRRRARRLQRPDLRQPGPGRPAAARVPRRLRVLPGLLHRGRARRASSCAARSAGG